MLNPSLISSAPLTEPNGVKVVYADLVGRVGARIRQLLQFPPSGYRVLARKEWADKVSDRAARQDRIWAMRNVLNRSVPINLALAYGPMRFKKTPNGIAFTYSESPLIFRPEPWVVGVEVAIQFAGYNHRHLERYRSTVERTLESSHCRAIICYSEAARRSVERALDVERFGQKLHVVYPAGMPKSFMKGELDGEPVRILFVSSEVTSGRFELKGGVEAFKAFVELRQRFPNLELTIRCDVDPRIRQCYEGTPGLRIVQGLVSRQEFEGFYQKADIFWYPAHTLMTVAMLEAMSYGVPVVTTDYYDNAEFVEDGRTGMVATHPPSFPAWDTSPEEVQKALPSIPADFVRALIEKTAILIENPELRRRMGRAARAEVDSGKFSLARKNQKLKAIFDQAAWRIVNP